MVTERGVVPFDDDLVRELVDVRPRRARRVAEQQERVVDAQLETLGEDSLRLLDDDPRLERGLKLRRPWREAP